jgi:hypothetical protein
MFRMQSMPQQFYAYVVRALQTGNTEQLGIAASLLENLSAEDARLMLTIRDREGNTVLHNLALHAHLDCSTSRLSKIQDFFRVLHKKISREAFNLSVKEVNGKGNTVLHIAAFGHANLFSWLLKNLFTVTLLDLLTANNAEEVSVLDYAKVWQPERVWQKCQSMQKPSMIELMPLPARQNQPQPDADGFAEVDLGGGLALR